MTRRSSVRALAREIYCQSAKARTPDPPSLRFGAASPSPQLAGEKKTTTLTKRVRALYEDSAVPVREIANIAGVTERTIYKYVEKHGWKKRYRVLPRGEAAALANRGRRWRPAPDVAPAKGAGGRFIRREDIGKPFAQGLKATDPAAAARAAADCRRAQAVSAQAHARADAWRRTEEHMRALAAVNSALDTLRRYRAERAKQRPSRAPGSDPVERAMWACVNAATDWCERLQRRDGVAKA